MEVKRYKHSWWKQTIVKRKAINIVFLGEERNNRFLIFFFESHNFVASNDKISRCIQDTGAEQKKKKAYKMWFSKACAFTAIKCFGYNLPFQIPFGFPRKAKLLLG